MDEQPTKILTLLLFFTGGVLNIVAGIVCFVWRSEIEYHNNKGAFLALGMTTIICGVLMIVDMILFVIKN